MNPIASYRKQHGLTQSAFAELMKPHNGATQGLISQWEDDPSAIPHARCIDIEKATGGAIRCNQLRTDVDWNRDKAKNVIGYTVKVTA